MNNWTAMVLAAGFGTRLRPLTDEIPKPLIPVANQPLLSLVLGHLFRWQPQWVVVNGHYHVRQLHDFLRFSPQAESLSFVHEPEILGTGGGIRNASALLGGEFFMTVNGDVLTDLPFDLVMDFHRRQADVLATMVFHEYPRFNSVQVAGERVISFNADVLPPESCRLLAYTGIQVCSPRLLQVLDGSSGFLSIIDVYERLLREEKEQIAAYIMPAGQYYWRDLGTTNDYFAIHRDLHHIAGLSDSLLGYDVDFPLVAPGVEADGADVSGSTVVAPRCTLAPGCRVDDSILWSGVELAENCRLQRCIVGQNVRISAESVLVDRVLVNEKQEVTIQRK